MTDKKPHGLTGRPSNNKGGYAKNSTATVSIRLPNDVWEKIEIIAKHQGISRNRLIHQVLTGSLEQP